MGFSQPDSDFAAAFVEGDRRCVPVFTWAQMAHPTADHPGGKALLTVGGGVTVVGWHEEHGVIAQYEHPEYARPPTGPRCADGARCYLPPDLLAGWPQAMSDAAYWRTAQTYTSKPPQRNRVRSAA